MFFFSARLYLYSRVFEYLFCSFKFFGFHNQQQYFGIGLVTLHWSIKFSLVEPFFYVFFMFSDRLGWCPLRIPLFRICQFACHINCLSGCQCTWQSWGIWSLWSVAFLFMLLITFDASPINTASQPGSSKIFLTARIAASHPVLCPAHTCWLPTSALMLFWLFPSPPFR